MINIDEQTIAGDEGEEVKKESTAITADFSASEEEEAPEYEKQELSEEGKAALKKFGDKYAKYFKGK